MRVPSLPLALSVLALALAGVALVVALGNDRVAEEAASETTRPSGLWRGLPADADLPEGWRVISAGAGSGGFTGSYAQLAGPNRLNGYLSLTQHPDGMDGAHLSLRDTRESADSLVGHRRESIERIGSEAVAVREQRSIMLGSEAGPVQESVIVTWRRGAVIVTLSVQDTPAFLGPGRTEPSRPIEMAAVEALARAVDARLERELR